MTPEVFGSEVARRFVRAFREVPQVEVDLR
jgi:hypothetical protein